MFLITKLGIITVELFSLPLRVSFGVQVTTENKIILITSSERQEWQGNQIEIIAQKCIIRVPYQGQLKK